MSAIVSYGGTNGPPTSCSCCHRIATRLCDWKVGKDRTCDKPMCPAESCGSVPAPGKDLCRLHTTMWHQRAKKKEPDSGETGSKSDGQKPLL